MAILTLAAQAAKTIVPFTPEALAQTVLSLSIMAKSLIGIFAVFFVLWGFVALLNRLTAKKEG